ncbi:hypothetical protein JHK87_005205 [Glycine soja]|nr:hypothetical protein JHK87_005205 [Glycine soja]
MANNKKQAGGSSSSTMKFDHLFGPKDSSSTTSSSTGLFGSIFPPPPSFGFALGTQTNKSESSSRISNKNTSTNYQNETVEPSYFSSSIYYGGQENYSPRSRTTQPHHVFKKDKDDGDSNSNDSNSAARGNWWQGRSRIYSLGTVAKGIKNVI